MEPNLASQTFRDWVKAHYTEMVDGTLEWSALPDDLLDELTSEYAEFKRKGVPYISTDVPCSYLALCLANSQLEAIGFKEEIGYIPLAPHDSTLLTKWSHYVLRAASAEQERRKAADATPVNLAALGPMFLSDWERSEKPAWVLWFIVGPWLRRITVGIVTVITWLVAAFIGLLTTSPFVSTYFASLSGPWYIALMITLTVLFATVVTWLITSFLPRVLGDFLDRLDRPPLRQRG